MILSILTNVIFLLVGIYIGRNYLRKSVKVKHFDGYEMVKRRLKN